MKMRTRRCIKWQLDYVIFPPFLVPLLVCASASASVFSCYLFGWMFSNAFDPSLTSLNVICPATVAVDIVFVVAVGNFISFFSSPLLYPLLACSISISFIWSSNFLRSFSLHLVYTRFPIQLSNANKRTLSHSLALAFATKLQLKLLIGCIYANGSNINPSMNKCTTVNTDRLTHTRTQSMEIHVWLHVVW